MNFKFIFICRIYLMNKTLYLYLSLYFINFISMNETNESLTKKENDEENFQNPTDSDYLVISFLPSQYLWVVTF